jgi:hypothetical protein
MRIPNALARAAAACPISRAHDPQHLPVQFIDVELLPSPFALLPHQTPQVLGEVQHPRHGEFAQRAREHAP